MAHHKEQSELVEKLIFANRCAKVIKGGRRFSFSALVVVGDSKGRVGFGFAKANELTDAIRKGGEQARKKLLTIKMHGSTIPHDVRVKQDGVEIMLKPAPEGAGIIAGSKARAVLELAGVHNVVAKNLGSSNPINQVKAIFAALESLQSREEIAKERGRGS